MIKGGHGISLCAPSVVTKSSNLPCRKWKLSSESNIHSEVAVNLNKHGLAAYIIRPSHDRLYVPLLALPFTTSCLTLPSTASASQDASSYFYMAKRNHAYYHSCSYLHILCCAWETPVRTAQLETIFPSWSFINPACTYRPYTKQPWEWSRSARWSVSMPSFPYASWAQSIMSKRCVISVPRSICNHIQSLKFSDFLHSS